MVMVNVHRHPLMTLYWAISQFSQPIRLVQGNGHSLSDVTIKPQQLTSPHSSAEIYVLSICHISQLQSQTQPV